jgi:Uma2 family endonuclease
MTTRQAVAQTLISGEELLAMGDIGPCELVDGRIVRMSPAGVRHGMIEFLLGSQLTVFVLARRLGWVFGGETGIYTRRNPDRVRGADIAFLSRARCPEKPAPGFLEISPDLIVEVMSPSDAWEDVRQKIEEYFAIGVHRVWVVEPENHAVLVFRSPTEMRRLGEGDTLLGEGALDGLSISVAEIFAD